MYALVGAYFLVFVLGNMPHSTLSTVLSMLPPIAPMLMPIRMAAGCAGFTITCRRNCTTRPHAQLHDGTPPHPASYDRASSPRP